MWLGLNLGLEMANLAVGTGFGLFGLLRLVEALDSLGLGFFLPKSSNDRLQNLQSGWALIFFFDSSSFVDLSG